MAIAPVTDEAKPYLDAIEQYDREFKKWATRAEKIVKIYRDYDSQSANTNARDVSFNILWSNIEVLMPAVFARLPKPDVSRRFRDNDPVGRVAALILERALEFEVQHNPDYRAAMDLSVLDRFLGGRGTAWVRHETNIVESPQISDDAEAYEEIKGECAPVDYVHWKDFGHNVARTWEEVTKVWRKVYLDRAALVKRFGEDGKKIPLDATPDQMQNSARDNLEKLALIYEVWDRDTKAALWISKSLGKVIDQRPDPLGLANFWPCPRPLFATLTSDSLIPVPDFKQYQTQAKQLDKLARKIDGLIDQLKVYGVYDSAVPELARLFKEADNGDLIPVKNFQQFAEKSGLKGTIDVFDIAPIISALSEAYDAQERVKNEIYELVGISDITRGASDPTETYGAQKLKGQYGNMRLRNKQDKVVLFATELLQIKAQVMCQHYQPQTLVKIAAVQQLMPDDQALVPQALQLLMGERAANPTAETQEGPLAGFRIEVSSDSMVQMDEQQEKKDRTEFLTAVGSFLEKVFPMAQQSPQAAPLLVGLLKFGVSGFKVGKTIEGMLDNSLDKLVKLAAQPQPPKPDPEMAKVQATSQAKQAEMSQKAQLDAAHLQMEERLEQSKQQFQAQQAAHTNELEAQRAQMQARMDAQLEAQRQANAKEIEGMRSQIALVIAQMNNAAKVEVAEVTAGAALDAAQMAAARTSSEQP